MTTIEDLSPELIHEILSYLLDDKRTISSMSVSSKSLCSLSRPYLYKNVELNLLSKNYTRFAQSLIADKALQTFVQSLTLSWTRQPSEELIRKKLILQSCQSLLSQLHLLKSFNLLIDMNLAPIKPPLHMRPVSSKTCLYTLTIRGQLDIDDLPDYIYKNRPNALNVNNTSAFSLINLTVTESSSDYDPVPLGTLNLHCSICISCDLLSYFLECTSTLRTLKCTTPVKIGDSVRFALLEDSEFSRARGPIAPSTIVSSLRSAASSLETLELFPTEVLWSCHDGSRLDLSSFTKLKHLSLPSYLLFEALEASSKRDRTYALLPPALEELIVTFDFGNYILTRFSRGTQESQTSNTDPAHYAWLSEIAATKADRFPNLHRLSLMERFRDSKGRKIPCVAWTIPEDLKQDFERADIELWTRMRV